jgi:hypothetical protein
VQKGSGRNQSETTSIRIEDASFRTFATTLRPDLFNLLRKKRCMEMEQGNAQKPAKALRIASRSKRVDGVVQEPVVVVLSQADLEKHFGSPLHVAAKLLGVCTTTLKG